MKRMSNIVKDVFKDYKGQGNILEAQIENINLFKKSNSEEDMFWRYGGIGDSSHDGAYGKCR